MRIVCQLGNNDIVAYMWTGHVRAELQRDRGGPETESWHEGRAQAHGKQRAGLLGQRQREPTVGLRECGLRYTCVGVGVSCGRRRRRRRKALRRRYIRDLLTPILFSPPPPPCPFKPVISSALFYARYQRVESATRSWDFFTLQSQIPVVRCEACTGIFLRFFSSLF